MSDRLVARLRELDEKATKGPWKVRRSSVGAFLQAPRAKPEHPYDIEVLGEDETLYETRDADMDALCALRNALPEIAALVEAAEMAAFNECGEWPEDYAKARAALLDKLK